MLDRFIKRTDEEEKKGVQGNSAPVHDLIPLQHMYGNMMVLKDGSYRMIMKVGAVNFDLKSDREKMLILASFGELLNVLQVDMPMQVLLHSTLMDTEQYIRPYRERLLDPSLSPQMRMVIEDHIHYFEEQARASYLLDRSYFIVVPYFDRSKPTGDNAAATDLPLGGALSRFLDTSSGEKKQKMGNQRDMERAKIQLENRCGLVASQLQRLNIHSRILDHVAVLRLLREMYNPTLVREDKPERVSADIFDTTRRPERRLRGTLPPAGDM